MAYAVTLTQPRTSESCSILSRKKSCKYHNTAFCSLSSLSHAHLIIFPRELHENLFLCYTAVTITKTKVVQSRNRSLKCSCLNKNTFPHLRGTFALIIITVT